MSDLRSSSGFGFNPISLSDIRAFLDLVGPPLYDVQTFIELITAMDREFLTLVNKKA